MKRETSSWMPLVLIASAVAVSIAVSSSVPATVMLPVDRVLPLRIGSDGGLAPKWILLYSMPTLAFIIWALFQWLRSRGAERLGRTIFHDVPDDVTSAQQLTRMGPTYDTIVLGVIVLVLGLHAGALSAALGAIDTAVRIIPVVAGAGLVMIGNVFPRLKPNWIAGIRTKRTMSDPALWRSTHRTSGAAFVIAGLVTMAAGFFAPRFGLVVAVSALLVALMVGFIASRSRGAAVIAAAVLLGAFPANGKAQMPLIEKIVELPTPNTVVETPFTFSRDRVTLSGTLTLPRDASGKLPVALIVAGSGATDRNANGPQINTNAYAMLAWALAEHGIASLRYDKRGIGQSTPPKDGDPSQLTLDSYVADVLEASTLLARDPRFSKVILIGHSEGAGLSLQAANRGAPTSSVIMISAQGRKFLELIREQFSRTTDSVTVARIDTSFARLLRGDDPGDVPPAARGIIVPAAANFLRSFVAYDPAAEAKRFGGRLLIVQGATDLQTTIDDAQLLAAAQPRATFVKLDGVNHVLKSVETTVPREQMASYRDPRLPLAPSVVTTIVRWISALP